MLKVGFEEWNNQNRPLMAHNNLNTFFSYIFVFHPDLFVSIYFLLVWLLLGVQEIKGQKEKKSLPYKLLELLHSTLWAWRAKIQKKNKNLGLYFTKRGYISAIGVQ